MRIHLLFTLIILALTSCGPSGVVRDSSDLSSRGSGVDYDGVIRVDSGLLAECNAFSDQVTELDGQLSTYYDPMTGQYLPTIIRMHLTNFPEAVVKTDKYYVQFFRWSEDVPGSRIVNSRPVSFYFVQEGSGYPVAADKPVDKLSQATFNNLIEEYKLSYSGVTPENFLDRHILVLTDMAMQYDAITMAVYDESQGSNSLAHIDVLLPPFSANPNTYNTNHPATALQSLHPNRNLATSGATDQEFYNYTKELCAGFFQKLDARNPASVKPQPGLISRAWSWLKSLWSRWL